MSSGDILTRPIPVHKPVDNEPVIKRRKEMIMSHTLTTQELYEKMLAASKEMKNARKLATIKERFYKRCLRAWDKAREAEDMKRINGHTSTTLEKALRAIGVVVFCLIALPAFAEPPTDQEIQTAAYFVQEDLHTKPFPLPYVDTDPEHFLKVLKSSPQFDGRHRPQSIYRIGTIYLSLAWRMRYLVHEMAGWAVDYLNMPMACPAARDLIAYKVENDWARAHGESEVSEDFIRQQAACP